MPAATALVPHLLPTPTLLADGLVLVAGARDEAEAIQNSLEIFVP